MLLGERVTAAPVPVPESDTTSGELVALLTTDTLPAALPIVLGAKVTLNVALLWAGRVSGSERPLMLKPPPVTVAREIVMFTVLRKVTLCVVALPTVAFPKFMLVGLADNCEAMLLPVFARRSRSKRTKAHAALKSGPHAH